ncbi:putative fatty acyl-CoA reductase [Lucilia cuprina]|uniref:Fatty acyl-CoA reductase n=1 Tax=Lucilia cuprina TaxID=7375 RepID=A0A0L0CCF0_LUCCU|nr:putative fatty acyl-CoA reductase [Lucilia cuprina]
MDNLNLNNADEQLTNDKLQHKSFSATSTTSSLSPSIPHTFSMTNLNEYEICAGTTTTNDTTMCNQDGQQNVIGGTDDVISRNTYTHTNSNGQTVDGNAIKHSSNKNYININNSSSDNISDSKTPIKDFYKDATILITGGTGFVGKVLIQKLLRAFEVRKIYMLIRCKDNMTVEQRLEQYFNESIFDTLRAENSNLFDKVHPIRANFSAFDLDIAAKDRELLCNEVTIVFNVVASVKFNEKIGDAIDINVLGTKKILDLAMEMKNLKSFVHISTLYCNCNLKKIQEKVYENEIGYEKIMQIFRIFDDETLEKFRPCLIGEMPNTYTMTKKCAENLVNHRAFYLPAGIFRPPIVMSTYKDPIPGWTDNLYGPSGLCTWSARGLVRCIYGNSKCKANMVPADYCVNAMISSAWDVARRYKAAAQESKVRHEIPVYNYIFDKNNLTWGQYMQLSRKGFHEPFDKALCFSYIIIPWKPLHYAASIFLHHIPAYVLDLIAMATGQKCIYIKAYSKITKIIYMMSWFGLKEWMFSNQNIAELDALMTDEEKKVLQFNTNTINWHEYFRSYLSGIRKYFFKDTENDLSKRKTFYRRWLFIHNLLKTSFGVTLIMCLLRIYYKLFKIIPKITL